jgi:hypothetical protein
MKKEIKINFMHYEEPFDVKNNFFIKLLKKYYKVTICSQPDYVFFSVYKNNPNFIGKNEKQIQENKKNMILQILKKIEPINDLIWILKSKKIIEKTNIPEIKGDFVKIFYTWENVSPDMNKCNWAFGFEYEENIKSKNYMRLPYYYVSSYGKSLTKKPKKLNKPKFCNFIYSTHFPLRNRFFKELSKYKKVDSPGKCLNNMPPIGSYKNPKDSRASKNWQEDKQKFLEQYKFTIAFENSLTKGYTTEKLTQAMLANSIPIYYGNPLIEKDFNKKSFINVLDFKNFQEVIQKIKEIDNSQDEYEKILREPWLNKNKKNKWMNEKRLINQFKKIFGE